MFGYVLKRDITRCSGKMHTLNGEVLKLTDHSHAPDVREEDVNNILLELRLETKSSTHSTRTVLVNAHNSRFETTNIESLGKQDPTYTKKKLI